MCCPTLSRALPCLVHSMAFRQRRQLFTDFNSGKLIFTRYKVLTAILMKIQVSWAFPRKKTAILVLPFPCQVHNFLPPLSNLIPDNPRSTSRFYVGTNYTHQFFQSTRLTSVEFPQISCLFHHWLHLLHSTAASTSSTFQFYLWVTSLIHGPSNVRGQHVPEDGVNHLSENSILTYWSLGRNIPEDLKTLQLYSFICLFIYLFICLDKFYWTNFLSTYLWGRF